MKITLKFIELLNHWEVNGKSPDELEGVEKDFYDQFLISIIIGYRPEKDKEIIVEDYVGENYKTKKK